ADAWLAGDDHLTLSRETAGFDYGSATRGARGAELIVCAARFARFERWIHRHQDDGNGRRGDHTQDADDRARVGGDRVALRMIEKACAAGQLTWGLRSEGSGAFAGRERSWRGLGVGGHEIESSGALGRVAKQNLACNRIEHSVTNWS